MKIAFPVMLKIALASLAAVLIAGGAYAQSETYRDWTVTCGANECSASTTDRNGTAGELTIARSADKTANWEIFVETAKERPSRVGPTSVRIAGQRPIAFAPNRDFATFGKANRFYLINSAYLQLLFRRMIESRRVFFTFDATDGREMRASYSLNGLAAALQRIDEKQVRLGSRREAGPPVPRLAPPDEKKTENALLEAARRLQRSFTNEDTCPDLGGESPVEPSIHTLEGSQILVLLPCFTAAYNFGMQGFVTLDSGKTLSPLSLPVFETETGWYATDILFAAGFDDEKKTLTTVYKGRGIGDCGTSATYRWSASRFVLEALSHKSECDGEANDWPQIFPEKSAD